MSPSTNMVSVIKRDLKRLTKGQLIAMLLKNEAKNKAKSQKPIPPPRTGKWTIQKPKPMPRNNVGRLVSKFEDLIEPPAQFRDEIIEAPMQFGDKAKEPLSGVKQKVESYEDLIIKPPKEFQDKPKKPQRQPATRGSYEQSTLGAYHNTL